MDFETTDNQLTVSYNKMTLTRVVLSILCLSLLLYPFRARYLYVCLAILVIFTLLLFILWLKKTQVIFLKDGNIQVYYGFPLKIFDRKYNFSPHDYCFILLISYNNWKSKKFIQNDSWLVFIADNDNEYYRFPGKHEQLALRKLSENLGHFYHIGIRDYTGLTPVFRAQQGLDTTYMMHIFKILTQEPGKIDCPEGVICTYAGGEYPRITIRSEVQLLQWFAFTFPLIFAFFFTLIEMQQIQTMNVAIWVAAVIASIVIFLRCLVIKGLGMYISVNKNEVSVHQMFFNLKFKHSHFTWKTLENIRLHGGDFAYMEFISDTQLEVIAVNEPVHNYIQYVINAFLFKMKPEDPEEKKKQARKHLRSRVLLEK
ncbi:hypothetical protein ACFL35_03090 [Candidatus Riflebacteria bacterium]